MDNISIVMIGFKKLQDYLDKCRVQTPPPIGARAETSHLVGGMKTGGFTGVLNNNNDSNLYSGSKLNEKTDILSQKSQTQKVEGIYSKLNASNNQSSNESTLRLDQIKQASRAAAVKEFESNRLSRNLPPY